MLPFVVEVPSLEDSWDNLEMTEYVVDLSGYDQTVVAVVVFAGYVVVVVGRLHAAEGAVSWRLVVSGLVT